LSESFTFLRKANGSVIRPARARPLQPVRRPVGMLACRGRGRRVRDPRGAGDPPLPGV